MKSNTYDIVLLDHMMPQMDGIETMQKLREGGLIPEETTVIALTANAVVGAREMYLEAGFDDYLSKPVALKDLEKKLLKYLPKKAFMQAETGEDGDTAGIADDGDTTAKADDGDEILEFAPEGEVVEFYPEDEYVEFYPEDEGKAPDRKDRKATLSRLKEKGILVDEGISYAAGDADFYLEILEDFCKGFKEKSKELQRFYEDGDLKNYEVLIHAIKSNARSVGAEDLRVLADRLEEAASEGRTDIIKEKHIAFMEQYEDTVTQVSSP